MSRIEVNSNDVELLDEELKSLQKKTKNLTDFVKSNFKICRQNQLYLNGLSRLGGLSDALGDDAKMLDTEMMKFNDEMSNIEEVFVKKFGEIQVPSIILPDEITFYPATPSVPAKYAPAPTVPTPTVPVPPVSPTISVGVVGTPDVSGDVAISGESQTELRDMTKTSSEWKEKKATTSSQSEELVPTFEEATEDELSKIMTEAEDVMSGITDSVSHTVSDTMSGFGGEI